MTGRTSLGDRARLPKFHVRVPAYDSVERFRLTVDGVVLVKNDTPYEKYFRRR
jgi:hypothetical protein